MNETGPVPPRTLTLTFASSFAVATAVAAWLAIRTGLDLFRALACLSLWGIVVTLTQLLPRWPFRLRPLLSTLIGVTTAAWLWWPRTGISSGATDTALQLAAVLLAILAFALHFLATYGAAVERETPSAPLATLVPFSRLLACAHALTGATLLVHLYAQRNWMHEARFVLLAVVLVIIAESFLHALFRFYQPKRLRVTSEGFGRSVLLPTLFGEAGPIRSLAAATEKNFGVKFAETWLVRLARVLTAPLALFGLLGLWASTTVTRVPVDSRGVPISRGEFQTPALSPGLHWHAPWPWASIAIVQTERVQELALGFERDLAGPVLWAEKHFEGEQNLLLGGGEELLTINVPVQYRVRDAVAFLRHTADPARALESLGYRQLLALTGEHTAFGLMTTDRAEVSDKIRSQLQLACDRLNLGLEIVFVGLKDVHPPVAVASAYQDVISAEEERSALVDQSRTYSVLALGSAKVAARLARIQAEAAATERRTRASGESSRFLAPLATYRAHADVFTTRLRLETLESALADLRQLYVVPAGPAARRSFVLGSDNASTATAVLTR